MTDWIPNQGGAAYTQEASPDATDFDALVAALGGTGVLAGCVVSAGTGLAVNVTAGTVVSAGATVAVGALTGLALSAASSTLDRKDIVVASASGVLSVVAGTGANTSSTPPQAVIAPAVPSGSVLLAEVYVPAGATTLAAGNLTRAGSVLTPPSLEQHVTSPPVAAVAGQTYYDGTVEWIYTGSLWKPRGKQRVASAKLAAIYSIPAGTWSNVAGWSLMCPANVPCVLKLSGVFTFYQNGGTLGTAEVGARGYDSNVGQAEAVAFSHWETSTAQPVSVAFYCEVDLPIYPVPTAIFGQAFNSTPSGTSVLLDTGGIGGSPTPLLMELVTQG